MQDHVCVLIMTASRNPPWKAFYMAHKGGTMYHALHVLNSDIAVSMSGNNDITQAVLSCDIP